MAQRRQDRGGRVHAGHQVGRRNAHFLRATTGRAVGFAGHAHQPADGLDGGVVAGAPRVGSILAVTGDRAVHQRRVERTQAGVIQPVLRQPADLVVFHQHLAVRGQRADQRLPLRQGEVDGDRALAAVGAQVVRRLGSVGAVGVLEERRPPAAGVVARPRTLYLDHVGAEIGQHLGGPRPGQDARQVKYAHAVEQVHRGVPPCAPEARLPGRPALMSIALRTR